MDFDDVTASHDLSQVLEAFEQIGLADQFPQLVFHHFADMLRFRSGDNVEVLSRLTAFLDRT